MQREFQFKASIIIPVLNEEKFIEECIESVASNTDDIEKMEIIVVDGGSEDNTVEIVKKISSKYKNLILLHNPKKITPISLNLAIKESSGEFIVRLDAHALYSKNYVNKCIQVLENSDENIGNVGGFIKTKPSQSSIFSKAVSLCLSSIFGVGISKFRISKPKKREFVDTVPFGCFRRSLFDEIGLFNEEEPRNEDLEFNHRILNSDKKIILDPDIHSTYFSRSTLYKLFFQQFDNGKIVTNKFRGKESFHKFRHFVPFLFFTYLLSIPFFSLIESFYNSEGNFIFFYLFPGFLYLILNVGFSFFIALKNKDILLFPIIIFVFFIIHLSYGLGSFFGIFRVEKKASLQEFLEETFPYKSTFAREEFGFFTNLVKFFSLRVAYFLYLFGLSANALTISSIFIASSSFYLLYTGITNDNINFAFLGYFLMCLVLFIDFVDGTLARFSEIKYKTGEALDNLPPDIIRVGSIFSFGVLSENIILILMSLVSSVIITRYIPETVENIKSKREWIKVFIGSRMSISGLRLISLFFMPSLIFVTFLFPSFKIFYSSFLAVMYFTFALTWLAFSLEDQEFKN